MPHAVLVRKHPSHVCALARGEPACTPMLLSEGACFARCNPMYMAAFTATPE
jgi:hypothetical protein